MAAGCTMSSRAMTVAPSLEIVTPLPEWINLSIPLGPKRLAGKFTESCLDDIDHGLARVDVRNNLGFSLRVFGTIFKDDDVGALIEISKQQFHGV